MLCDKSSKTISIRKLDGIEQVRGLSQPIRCFTKSMKKTTQSISRRRALSLVAGSLTITHFGCTRERSDSPPLGAVASSDASIDHGADNSKKDTTIGESMKLHYLEVVTKEVDAACKLYAQIHGVTFGEPVQSLGGARTANVKSSGMIGIRAPMHAGEKPVTRAYMLVENIEASVSAAAKAGAEIAVPPMKIDGYGQCAIYILGGIEAGFWQL